MHPICMCLLNKKGMDYSGCFLKHQPLLKKKKKKKNPVSLSSFRFSSIIRICNGSACGGQPVILRDKAAID